MMDPLKHSSNGFNASETIQAEDLLNYYSFELVGCDVDEQIGRWLDRYSKDWIKAAIIEALYQGRYKIISVEQILSMWKRRGEPIYHFNHEFERLVCGNLPRSLVHEPEQPTQTQSSMAPHAKPELSYRKMLLELPSIHQATSELERLTEIPALKLARVSRGAALLISNVQELHESHEHPAGSSEAQSENQNHSEATEIAALSQQLDEVKTQNAGESTDSPLSPVPEKTAIAPPMASRQLHTESDSEREFQEFKEGVVFALSASLAASALKPNIRMELSQRYCPNWMAFLNDNLEIEHFVPTVEPSQFHNKLRAVALPQIPADPTTNGTSQNGQAAIEGEVYTLEHSPVPVEPNSSLID